MNFSKSPIQQGITESVSLTFFITAAVITAAYRQLEVRPPGA
ncbi:MAG: hypothetical protein VB023_11665 [Oscillibacter sp.]|nr:hypothetical protein [Oscillibacter sp.]